MAHPPLRTHFREIVIGLVGGAVLVASGLVASNADEARLYLGVWLAAIGFVYIGFAIADGRRSAIVVQAVAALVFLNVAQWGVREDSDLLLGIGFLAHGVWDVLHHEGRGPTRVRTYYPPFCAAADVLIGAAILLGITSAP